MPRLADDVNWRVTMRDEVVWDDEECDDVMNMTDRVMGY